MRVLFSKIHQCPFMCFYKPSVSHIYSLEPPLKLENTTQVVVTSSAYAVCDASDHKSTVYADVNDMSSSGSEEEGVNGNYEAENGLKSCIKKLPSCPDSTANEVGKKRVQWKDKLGKQLSEIKEFESSETGDTDNENENSCCVCVIL